MAFLRGHKDPCFNPNESLDKVDRSSWESFYCREDQEWKVVLDYQEFQDAMGQTVVMVCPVILEMWVPGVQRDPMDSEAYQATLVMEA